LTLYAKWTENIVEAKPEWENPFADIREGDWYYDSVSFAHQKGLFGGTSDTAFSPSASMTRAMFATVLWRLAGEPENSGSAAQNSEFSDVAADAWYHDAVSWAAANGIVNGVGNGRFDPDAPVTREQIAVILMNYVRGNNLMLRATVDAASFADESAISGWAGDAVRSIQRAGIIGGKPGNLFDPHGIATRAEVATIFSRLADVLG